MRRDADPEGEPVLVDRQIGAGPDAGLAHELAAPVAQHQLVVAHVAIRLALLLQGVLDLEQVGEVGASLDLGGHLDRVGCVVEQDQVLVEAVADVALADYRQARVLVDGAGRPHEKELGREVVDVVGGQRLQRLTIEAEPPA